MSVLSGPRQTLRLLELPEEVAELVERGRARTTEVGEGEKEEGRLRLKSAVVAR